MKFTLTEQHLKLLGAVYVSWNEISYGAPMVDPKRPYGNSSVEHDVAEILGISHTESLEHQELLRQLHHGTEHAMQIVLQRVGDGKLAEPGTYIKHGSRWYLVVE